MLDMLIGFVIGVVVGAYFKDFWVKIFEYVKVLISKIKKK
jgi:Na+/H+-dicarboxylate symporter